MNASESNDAKVEVPDVAAINGPEEDPRPAPKLRHCKTGQFVDENGESTGFDPYDTASLYTK